ncbi:glycoside hydrolase family 1 protein [Endozoicomonas sp. 4G]|uniref:glycoside hydrolase family 1 protein n=1 Tax=Endozoicomonas sp. 4G TaxID=2872754 RepID=UPI002078EB29|nr:glycoside hydrolase family 1 protein [Endozoicomonas sp. 4G]
MSTPEHLFPKHFWWGSATSATQCEGASREGGRGPNVWDFWYEKEPEKFHHQVGPCEASTFYKNYKNDIALMKELGHNSFRTSISWSRLIPAGTGEVNPQAVAFYNDMIDELIRQGIEPVINLFHFDLPVPLVEKGGWESRETVEAFAEYAEKCFELFGHKVNYWFTQNEPIVPVEAGYLNVYHWPCVVDFKRAAQVAYHSILANACAIERYRKTGLAGKIGIILNLSPTYARSDSPEDQKAAHIADLFCTRAFLDPVTKGTYPRELVALLKAHGQLPDYDKADLEIIAANTIDVLGFNYYQPRRVKAREVAPAADAPFVPENFYDFYQMPGRKMNEHRGWEIYEKGVYDTLLDLRDNYDNIEVYISENGMGVEGEKQFEVNGQIQDDYRIDFISDHLKWIHKASEEGSRVRGYHLWTFIDCWSWLNAYKNRYGFVSLDLETQERTIKKSGLWFRDVARNNGF